MEDSMKVFLFLLSAVLLSPVFATAAPDMDHSKMNHAGMEAAGQMIDLGSVTENGVEALAEMKDISKAMAQMGMEATHHFMVMFVDTKNFEPIEEGVVALKITSPPGETSDAVKLMGMHGGYGSDIALKEKGAYTFQVGTKLADGQKRQFEFKFHNH